MASEAYAVADDTKQGKRVGAEVLREPQPNPHQAPLISGASTTKLPTFWVYDGLDVCAGLRRGLTTIIYESQICYVC